MPLPNSEVQNFVHTGRDAIALLTLFTTSTIILHDAGSRTIPNICDEYELSLTSCLGKLF